MADNPTVLLVEDNEDDIELARKALAGSPCPHVLRVARDGREAIAYIEGDEATDPTPEVVLLDLKLPKLDGKVVLRELRGNPRTARVPVVVLTSSLLEQDVMVAYALGANSYYQKPIQFEAFRAGMSILLPYWFQLNQPPVAAAGRRNMSMHRNVAVPETATQAGPRRRSPGPGHAPQVLVIDGWEKDREATKEALETMVNAEPIAAISSFAEATTLIRGFKGPPPYLSQTVPRLVFVDLDLDGGDGRDLLQAIRYRCDHHTVLVVFTREAEPNIVSECYRLKVNSFVRKPDDFEEYRHTVRLICHYWIRLNQRPPPPGDETGLPRPG